MEKTKIEDQMGSILKEREMFLRENHTLSTTTCTLKKRLMEIESKTAMVMSEKERVENQCDIDLPLLILIIFEIRFQASIKSAENG